MSTQRTPASSSATAGPESSSPWQGPVSKFGGLVHLAPPVNHPEDPLTVVVEAFSRDPGAGAVFIVDGDDHLLGCIREEALDADVVRLILPQRLWSPIDDMNPRPAFAAERGPRLQRADL